VWVVNWVGDGPHAPLCWFVGCFCVVLPCADLLPWSNRVMSFLVSRVMWALCVCRGWASCSLCYYFLSLGLSRQPAEPRVASVACLVHWFIVCLGTLVPVGTSDARCGLVLLVYLVDLCNRVRYCWTCAGKLFFCCGCVGFCCLFGSCAFAGPGYSPVVLTCVAFVDSWSVLGCLAQIVL
jgi:hypothetical protein